MKRLLEVSVSVLCLFALFRVPATGGQTQADFAPSESEKPEPASVSGIILSQRGGLPLKRASIVLRPHTAGFSPLSDTTGEDGRYSFPSVPPGIYDLSVARDGFLSSSTGWIQSYRFPPVFTLRPGAVLTGLNFRLYPWCIVSGQITFQDADPAVNAEVALYRDVWRRGRHIYEIAARARTDDRGQYRLYDIAPGTYFISAEWSKPVSVPGAVEEPRRDDKGAPLPDRAYAVTFYPSSQTLLDAAPVHLGYGAEAGGMDIILSTARTVRIQGHVMGGAGGQLILNPGITLRRVGANDALAVGAAVTLNLDRRGGFELSGVTPGTYELIAEADEEGKHLIGRRLVPVGDESISNLEILASPPVKWAGIVQFGDDKPSVADALAGMTVDLEARDDLAPDASALVKKDGSFELELTPGETYDLYLKNMPAGAYLASARSGGIDLLAGGASLAPGAPPEEMHLILSRSGAEATGSVLNGDRTAAPGVNIDLVPDPPAGRYRSFQSGYGDEYGRFHLTGIAPGKYILIAWAGEAPCDVYNPDDLGACREAGVEVTFGEGAQDTITLKLASGVK